MFNFDLMQVYKKILQLKSSNQKSFAILIDPDSYNPQKLMDTIKIANDTHADYFFIGGSHMHKNYSSLIIEDIKRRSDIPCVLFPGHQIDINTKADAILYLSLISGRNPEFLIGRQVETAMSVKASELEAISTGYMLVDGGKLSSVHYVSNTIPLPHDKPNLAVSTAVAGELLGLKMIYLEAGSGAKRPVSDEMIAGVSEMIDVPLIVGGGIRDYETAISKLNAGADIIVLGTIVEEDPELLVDISSAVHSFNKKYV